MNNFKNEFAIGLGKSMKPLKNLFFALSSVGSAIAIGFILIGASGAAPSFAESPIIYTICFIIGLAVAIGIDFLLIGKAGKVGFAEIFALFSGKFYFTSFRKFFSLFMLILGFSGVVVSFLTSWYGSEMAATLSIKAPENNHGETVKIQRAQTVKAVKPYREAVKAVKVDIQKAIDTKVSNRLKNLAKRKDDVWAKGEIAKIEARVRKQYSAKLEAAESALRDAEKRETKYSQQIINSSLATIEANEIFRQNKVNATSIFIKLIGVLPLVLGVVLLLAEATSLVNSQIPEEEIKKQKEQKKRQNKAGQRSGDLLENICVENPS